MAQVIVHDPDAIAALDTLPVGPIEGTVTLTLGEPVERPAVLRNVVGLLRGSDPKLRDEYVIVSAHYDHIGVRPTATGDRIFNGANDDGSGTVAVVELASALAKVQPRPKRSILFVTFFGEEHGLLGSRYFGRKPVVPLKSIVAHVNLEQVGRTDDREGPQVNRASMTGFDFSEVGAIFAEAGQATGVEVFKHPRNSDAFFGRSDNQALADLGIPAHTLCVAYIYPDYHGLADHWDRIDYDNFARVCRTFGLGILMIADRPEPPAWNAENPKASRYLKAWNDLHEPRND
jgi:Zn-dependent M28 family amino/carboxypeptidase